MKVRLVRRDGTEVGTFDVGHSTSQVRVPLGDGSWEFKGHGNFLVFERGPNGAWREAKASPVCGCGAVGQPVEFVGVHE